jgi:hypothetical protein
MKCSSAGGEYCGKEKLREIICWKNIFYDFMLHCLLNMLHLCNTRISEVNYKWG